MLTLRPFIVGIGGSTRRSSSTDKALSLALASAAAMGAKTRLFSGADLLLPPYDYDDSAGMAAANPMLAALKTCDGILLASPSYHGSISGLLKNALDYVEALRAGDTPYFDGKAVGCIALASGWQGVGTTLVTMRSVVHALRGWPTPMGAAINTTTPFVDADGECTDPSVKFQLETLARQVVEFCEMRSSSRSKLIKIAV